MTEKTAQLPRNMPGKETVNTAHNTRQRDIITLLVLPALTLLLVVGCQSSQTYDLSAAIHGDMSSRVLSHYGSLRGVTGGRRRDGMHAGVDFGAPYGSPILAAADGTVKQVINPSTGCGLGIIIWHKGYTPERFTVYCHAKSVPMHIHKKVAVKRGDIIGQVGTTGQSSNVPHVHFVVMTEWSKTRPIAPNGDLRGSEDPMLYLVGCFDPTNKYPSDRLVLTAPVDC